MKRAWRLVAFTTFLSFALLTSDAAPKPCREADAMPDLNVGLEKVAGSYYLGDGLAANLTLVIKPTGTFTYHASGCLRTYADVEARAFMRNRMLMLASGKSGSQGSETRFLPVRWGERLYLIEPERIVGFANAINAGYEPRTTAQGVFYLRSGDFNKPVAGLPKLPAAYREYLLARPVEARVVRLSGPEEDPTFELDAGRGQGLRPGMRLISRDAGYDDEFCKLTLVAVAEDTAKATGNWVCSDLPAGARATTRWRDVNPPYRWEDDFDPNGVG